MTTTPGIIAGAVAIVAIVAATIGLCLGQLEGGEYVGIVGTFGGVATGAGLHAAGVKQGQP